MMMRFSWFKDWLKVAVGDIGRDNDPRQHALDQVWCAYQASLSGDLPTTNDRGDIMSMESVIEHWVLPLVSPDILDLCNEEVEER